MTTQTQDFKILDGRVDIETDIGEFHYNISLLAKYYDSRRVVAFEPIPGADTISYTETAQIIAATISIILDGRIIEKAKLILSSDKMRRNDTLRIGPVTVELSADKDRRWLDLLACSR